MMKIMRNNWILSIILLVGGVGFYTPANGMIWQDECATTIAQLAERQREVSHSHHTIEKIKLTKQFSKNFQVNWNMDQVQENQELSHAIRSLEITLNDFNVDLSRFQKECLSN